MAIAAAVRGDRGERADSFVRSRMPEALALLVLRGELAREEVARYLRDAFSNSGRTTPTSSGTVGRARSALFASRSSEASRELRARPDRSGRHELCRFEADLKNARAHPDSPWRSAAPDEFAPVEDTIAELAPWQHRIPADLERGLADDWALGAAAAEPATNPFRNVGRNDSCPCGSGKKLKKCCLR